MEKIDLTISGHFFYLLDFFAVFDFAFAFDLAFAILFENLHRY
jgi:hypothetical protein